MFRVADLSVPSSGPRGLVHRLREEADNLLKVGTLAGAFAGFLLAKSNGYAALEVSTIGALIGGFLGILAGVLAASRQHS